MDGLPQPFADPAILLRTAAVVAATGAAGGVLLIARTALPPRAGPVRTILLPAARDGYLYLLIALATRFAIQQHRSRLQILVLLGVVTAVEVTRLRPGTMPRRSATWLMGSAAVCLGVVLAKWALEPGALTNDWDRLRTEATDVIAVRPDAG